MDRRTGIVLAGIAPARSVTVVEALFGLDDAVEPVNADTFDEVAAAIEGGALLVVAEHRPPDFSVDELAVLIRAIAADVPVVGLHAPGTRNDALRLLDAGVADVVAWDDPAGLAACVHRLLPLVQLNARRRSAEDDLRLRDRAMAAATQGIIICDARDPECPVIYSNPAFSRITGYESFEINGRNCRFLQGVGTDRTATEAIRYALEKGEPYQCEILNYRKDGMPFWNSLSITPVRDATGTITHFIGFQNDVSAERAARFALAEAQKFEALGRLAGGVAHDFNNLLSVFSCYAEMLEMSLAPGSEEAQIASEMVEAAQRGARLTRQLLNYSHTANETIDVFSSREELRRIVAALTRMLGRGVKLVFTADDALMPVEVSRSGFEQAIINLAVNARDAMKGQGTITIHAVEVPHPLDGTRVEITVADTGPGIRPEIVPQIFQPFFSTKAPGEGAGLGLALVQNFARTSGGEIRVRSEPGSGAAFTLCLPRATTLRLSARQPVTTPPKGSGTILLIEPNLPSRQTFARSLVALGYSVRAVENESAAVAAASEFGVRFDCVLYSVLTPVLSPDEHIVALRRAQPNAQWLYLLSGSRETDSDDVDRIQIAAGEGPGDRLLDGLSGPALRKPVSLHELAVALRMVVVSAG
jgi:two-component system, cell cycle sensor histidine kinase and response regulator CckA